MKSATWNRLCVLPQVVLAGLFGLSVLLSGIGCWDPVSCAAADEPAVGASDSADETADPTKSYALVSQRTDGTVDLVSKQIDVTGKLLIRVDTATGESTSTPNSDKAGQADGKAAEQTQGTDKTDAKTPDSSKIKEQQIALKVSSKQEYEEMLITDGNLLQGEFAKPIRGAMFFKSDETTITVGDTTEKPALDKDQPLVGVEIQNTGSNFFRPNGLLTREERDLIDQQGCTLLLDKLLPNRTDMKIGDTWKQSPEVMAALLQLDLVYQIDIKTTFSEVKSGVAILNTEGWIEGSSDSTSSKINIEGKMYFDLKRGRIIWFGMIIREKRAAGYIAPGMDVAERLQYRIKPLTQSSSLTEKTVSEIRFDPALYNQLLFKGPEKTWEFVQDSHWYPMTMNDREVTFRLVKGGNLIAQCTVATPLNVKETQNLTMEDFASNIQKALGAGFEKVLNQNVSRRDDGTEVYRVEVSGTANDLPLRWFYYLITKRGDEPRQKSVVFTVENDLLEQFNGSDVQMIETFQWK